MPCELIEIYHVHVVCSRRKLALLSCRNLLLTFAGKAVLRASDKREKGVTAA